MILLFPIFLVTSFLYFPFSLGIILPGPCPKLVPTGLEYENSEQITSLTYTLSVPYSSKNNEKSYFFRERHFLECLVVSVGNERIDLLHPEDASLLIKGQFWEDEETTKEGNVFLESYLIIPEKEKCRYPTFTERVRIWQVNGTFLLWSCRNMDDQQSHDEALLIAYVRESSNDSNLFDLQIESAKTAVNLFLLPSLIDAIEWPTHQSKCDGRDLLRLPCPTTKSYFLIGVCVVASIAMVLLLFKAKTWFTNRSNLVVPFRR